MKSYLIPCSISLATTNSPLAYERFYPGTANLQQREYIRRQISREHKLQHIKIQDDPADLKSILSFASLI